MKSFYEAIIASGGFAGEVFDVTQGPANLDIIDILLNAGNGALSGNAPINMISTGALGAPRSLDITGVEQNGRMFFFSIRNTDLASNPLTIAASTDINGGGLLIVDDPIDYVFVHESSGVWRAYIQNIVPVSGSSGVSFTAQNKDVVTIRKGQPVTIHSSGSGIVLASASSLSTLAIGLAAEDITVGANGLVTTTGPFTNSDWTNTVGSLTLSTKKFYYLSTVAGKLVVSPPSSSGQYAQLVGNTIDSTSLSIMLFDAVAIG